MNPPQLCVLIPCCNEEEILQSSLEKIDNILLRLADAKKIQNTSFILCIDDGSRDNTWNIVQQMHNKNSKIKGLKLSRNFGHQNALFAGLMWCRENCDCALSIDADLQQDESKIPEFVDKFNAGNDIVFGVRYDRSADSAFKKFTALFFYELMKKLGVNIMKNHADYRLISKKALQALSEYEEVNLFLRGLIPSLGFKSDIVHHEVKPREAGETKYSLFRMLSFAWNGITSFSIVPIRFISLLGFFISLLSSGMILDTIYRFYTDQTVVGWSTLMVSMYFLGGIQLLSLGIIGEYIGKIYNETKRRPKFIIDEKIV